MIYIFLISFIWCCHFFELLLLATFTIIDILLHYNTFCLSTSVSEINRKKHVFLHTSEKWCKKEHLTLLTEAKLQTDFTHVIINNSPSLSPHWCIHSLHYFMSFANSIYIQTSLSMLNSLQTKLFYCFPDTCLPLISSHAKGFT